MKPQLTKTNTGGTLLIVLTFVGVLSVVLLTMLRLSQSASLLTSRSWVWNGAMPTAEAGIEEALTQIQVATNNLATYNWTVAGHNATKTRSLQGAYYTVLITPTNAAAAIGPLNPPTIYSTGFVQVPFEGGYIGRTVRVTTACHSYYNQALLAKSSITMSGAATVDSFDSSNPTYSTNGIYDPTKRNDQATLACTSLLPGCINMSSAQLYGYAATSFGGSVSPGTVGDLAYVNNPANNGTIEAGHSTNNLQATFPDVSAPFTSGASFSSGMVNGTNYTYVASVSTNYYVSGDFYINGGQSMIITNNAVIYVNGSFTCSGSGFMYLAPNSSLTLYIAGPSATISGGGLVNGTQNASKCAIYGLPTLLTGTYSGSAGYIGTVYAPEANWTISGSAAAVGAFTANSFTITGGGGIHYDQALGNDGRPTFAITSWLEL